jgi:hypothetical protein
VIDVAEFAARTSSGFGSRGGLTTPATSHLMLVSGGPEISSSSSPPSYSIPRDIFNLMPKEKERLDIFINDTTGATYYDNN